MASATTMSPVETKNSSIQGLKGPTSPNDSTISSSVDYWTALIRQNLATAQLVTVSDNDHEDETLTAIDEEIMSAPRRKSPRDALAREIAAVLYPAPPDSLAPIIRYEKDIVMLRSMYVTRSGMYDAQVR